MDTRKFSLSVVVAVVFGITSTGTAVAQGSLNWAAGYPIPVAAPVGQPLGSVKVLANYTTDPNWAAGTGSLFWQQIVYVNGVPTTVGAVQSQTLVTKNGMMGRQDPNNVNNVVEYIQPLPKGTYEVYIASAYQWASPMPNPNPPNSKLMKTVVFTITIN